MVKFKSYYSLRIDWRKKAYLHVNPVVITMVPQLNYSSLMLICNLNKDRVFWTVRRVHHKLFRFLLRDRQFFAFLTLLTAASLMPHTYDNAYVLFFILDLWPILLFAYYRSLKDIIFAILQTLSPALLLANRLFFSSERWCHSWGNWLWIQILV